MKKKAIIIKLCINIIGIIVGISTILYSIINFDTFLGRTMSHLFYGGDAYTGIQNAAAQTATNIYYNSSINVDFYKIVLIIAGTLIILHYFEKLIEILSVLKNNKVVHNLNKSEKYQNKSHSQKNDSNKVL